MMRDIVGWLMPKAEATQLWLLPSSLIHLKMRWSFAEGDHDAGLVPVFGRECPRVWELWDVDWVMESSRVSAERGVRNAEVGFRCPRVYEGGWTSLVHLSQTEKRFFGIVWGWDSPG